MSTLAEIQEAVARLPDNEKHVLAIWLDSQMIKAMSPADEERLLRSLDEAARDVDAGNCLSIEDVRKQVALWAAR